MNKLVRAVVVAAASLSLVAGTAVSADAAKRAHVNVVKLSAGSVTVSNTKCKTVKAKIKVKGNSPYWNASVKVTKGGKKLSFTRYGYSTHVLEFMGGIKGGKTAKLKVCPKKIGLGKVTLGPTKTHVVLQPESLRGHRDRTDRTKGHFYIRGKAKVGLKAAKSGSTVKLTALAKRFKPTKKRPAYVAFNRTVKFQAKTSHGWKTLKTKKLRHGTGSITLKKQPKRRYRVTFAKISTATGATSKIVRS